MAPADYLKPTELAARLRVHRQTIRNWTKSGKLTPVLSHGRVIRYDWTQVVRQLGLDEAPAHPAFEVQA